MILEERRRFLRHPIRVPIKIHLPDREDPGKSQTGDLSGGGLLFSWPAEITPGTSLEITLPIGSQAFRMKGCVAYCVKNEAGDTSFRIGVAFEEPAMSFRLKLAEEVYRIQEYRYQVSRLLGRLISEEEAAAKWIEKYATRFAELYQA